MHFVNIDPLCSCVIIIFSECIVLQKNFIVLSHLTKLDLSKNQIEELPENFGDLVRLKHLDLYRNNLKHLPLSFSQLKSLKWLDLKDNPLVPRITEVAGPCLDNKQCQDCARKIVIFYTQLQQQVEKEKEIREKHRQQNLLINSTSTKKAQEKKSKKKQKKEKSENGVSFKMTATTNNSKENNITPCDTSIPKVHKSLVSFVFYVLLLIFAFIMVLFICTSLKLSYTKNVEEYARDLWNISINKLPVQLQHVAVRTGQHINEIHVFMGNQISRVVEVYFKK